jgi:diketogulonate reductase-like aldo/keto reductase
MGSERSAWKAECFSLRLGIELGMSLIDTAEMYGDGAAERLVGEAIDGLREQVFLVSKVLPSHASKSGVRRACEASLKRLRTDRIDLYLLHWRGSVSLGETIDGFEALRRDGMIGDWGVSNFDVDDMQALVGLARPRGCLANQVLYNLEHRGMEFDLLRYSLDQGVPLMAYSPVGQGGALLGHPALAEIGRRHGKTPAQIALAWTLRHPNVISIPKAASEAHVRENAEAGAIRLEGEDLAALDEAFPPPAHKVPLAIL